MTGGVGRELTPAGVAATPLLSSGTGLLEIGSFLFNGAFLRAELDLFASGCAAAMRCCPPLVSTGSEPRYSIDRAYSIWTTILRNCGISRWS